MRWSATTFSGSSQPPSWFLTFFADFLASLGADFFPAFFLGAAFLDLVEVVLISRTDAWLDPRALLRGRGAGASFLALALAFAAGFFSFFLGAAFFAFGDFLGAAFLDLEDRLEACEGGISCVMGASRFETTLSWVIWDTGWVMASWRTDEASDVAGVSQGVRRGKNSA